MHQRPSYRRIGITIDKLEEASFANLFVLLPMDIVNRHTHSLLMAFQQQSAQLCSSRMGLYVQGRWSYIYSLALK